MKRINDLDWRMFVRHFSLLMRPFRSLAVKAVLFITLLQLLATLEPFFVKSIMDAIFGNDRSHGALPTKLSVMFAALVVVGLVQVLRNLRLLDVMNAIEHDLPIASGKKLLRLPLVYHQTENTGLIIGKVVRGVGKTMDLTAVLLWEIVPLVIQTVITAAMMLWFRWQATLVLVPIVTLFAWQTVRVKMKMAELRMRRHDLDNVADEILGQAVTNAMTTQSFVQENREMAAVTSVRDDVLALARREFRAYAVSDFFRNAIITAGRVGVVAVCAYAALAGTITVGTFTFITMLAEKVFISCYRIGAIFDRMMDTAEPVKRMTAIFSEPDLVADPPSPTVPSRFAGAIEFAGVVYAYKNRRDEMKAKPALHGVSLVVAAGETLGIVGESGGGKTTLVKLLMRFDDPDTGAVRIDGIDLRDMRLGDFRRQIGYVPQDVEIYDATVAENIAYGRPDASREEIERAARIANAHDFIVGLERDYDTVVGNRGLRLSGGQRQRIGIARAVLLDPPILVFDEATSHVDVVSEQKIQRAIEELRRGKTVLVIAHRLSTIQNADRIIVMDDGLIKEVGSHGELIRQGGLYRRLVALQTRVDATL